MLVYPVEKFSSSFAENKSITQAKDACIAQISSYPRMGQANPNRVRGAGEVRGKGERKLKSICPMQKGRLRVFEEKGEEEEGEKKGMP